MDTTSTFSYSAGVTAHLVYFGIACVAVLMFVAIYVAVTPHREFRLLREGNTAAAISLGGALLGYSIPLAKAVSQSEGIHDMLIWSGVALVAQVVAYAITRLILPKLSADVNQGRVSSAIFLAAVSICIGMLNAAAMSE
jgi:putative membrane protein